MADLGALIKISANINSNIKLGEKHTPNKLKSPIPKKREKIDEELKNATLYHFREKADEHYFFASTWLCEGILWYGLFAGQQMIELYLKSLFKLVDSASIPPHHHQLITLRKDCIQLLPQNEFLKSKECCYIVRFFDRFYQFPRYPVLTKDIGSFGFASLDAIDYLHLFVFEMRKIVPIGSSSQEWDLLGDNWRDHPIFLHPEMERKYHECFAKSNPLVAQ